MFFLWFNKLKIYLKHLVKNQQKVSCEKYVAKSFFTVLRMEKKNNNTYLPTNIKIISDSLFMVSIIIEKAVLTFFHNFCYY